MPFKVEHHPESGIIVVSGVGAISAEDHDAMLEAIENACDTGPASRVILDLSEVDYILTADEARALAQHVVGLAKSRCLIAVVGKKGAQYGMARMVQTISTIRDVVAAAFSSLEEAMAWMRAEPNGA